MELRIPMLQKGFYVAEQIPQVKGKLLSIKQDYAQLINKASNLTGVSEDLITSVIFLESAGNANAKSPSGAVGLMQISPKSVSGILFFARKKGKLTPELIAELTRHFGNKISCYLKQKYVDEPLPCLVPITTAEMLKPALNILVGALFLAILIEENNEGGKLRLDKVIARYNRGYFYKPKGTPEELLATSKPETRAYILKLVGINSTLDILIA